MIDLLKYFNNTFGLWALSALGVLFLIYLIKPKIKDKMVPSLIFLIKQTGKSRQESFFRTLLRDWLLLFHLLLILGLALSIADPIYFTDKNLDAEFTVLVLDMSASMQAQDGLGTAFDRMKSEAKNYLNSEKISILAIENDPRLILDKGDRDKALQMINSLEPKESLSPVGNAILAASDIVGDKNGRIVVISDFINSYGLDPTIAKTSVEAKDRPIEFVNVKESSRKNIGIVNLEFIDDNVRVTMHNYNTEPAQVPVIINEQNSDIKIPADWEERLLFTPQPGINKIELETDDDFAVDDIAYISAPQQTKKKILLISNKEQNFIYPMLKAYAESWNNHITIELAEPPKLPIVDHQIIIVDSVLPNKFATSVQENIMDLVEEGKASLIVTAQDSLEALKLTKILPVTLKGPAGEADVFNQNTLSQITNDVGFTKVNKHFKAKAKDKTTSIARTADNTTIIGLGSYGQGLVAYYGIFDEESTFKYDVSYPVFWQQLLDYMLGDGTLQDLNYRVKDQVILDTELPVKTPTKQMKTQVVDFDEVGMYSIRNRQVASNLLHKVESNVNFEFQQTSVDGSLVKEKDAQIKRRIIQYFIYGILTLLFLELLYIKFRGDL